MYISLVQRRMFQWCSRAFIWIVQVDVQEFVDSKESSLVVFLKKSIKQNCSKVMFEAVSLGQD